MTIVQAAVNIGEEFNSPWGVEGGLLFGDLISIILSGGLVIAGVIVVFLFVLGGFHIIQGAGGGDAKATAQGKDAITWAVVGFFIVFSAYWILRLLVRVFGIPLLIAI